MKPKLNLSPAGRFQAALASFLPTLLMGLLLCMPALTRARAQLFYDDFEAYQAGSFPSNGWTLVYNGAGDQFQRVESGTAASGTNALRLVGQPGWAAEAERPVQFPLQFAVEAMVFTEPTTSGSFGAANPALGGWGIWYGLIGFRQGQIQGRLWESMDLANWDLVETNLTTYETGRWYHAKSVYNFLARTFDVYIDGQLIARGLPILNDGSPTVVGASGEESILLIDQIKVTSIVEKHPLELAPKGTWRAPGTNAVRLVTAEGGRALVGTDSWRTHLLETTDPANPRLLGTWESIVPPSALSFINGLGLVAGYEPDLLSTVELVDFSDPAHPVLRDFVDTPGYAQDVACAGQLVLVADGDGGLLILDAADPANLREINRYPTSGPVRRVQVNGDRAYLGLDGGLLILDITDPTKPLRLGAYATGSAIRDLKVVDSTIYLLEEGGGFRILDCRQPRNLVVLGTGWAMDARAVEVQGGFAFLASGSLGLQVLDVSDPSKPQWAAGYATDGIAEDLAVSGNHVWVAAGAQGLLAFEFLDRRLRLERSAGAPNTLHLSWQSSARWELQRAISLSAPDWQTVPGSQNTNTMTLSVGVANAFFRLVRP